jgi:RND family efflux transporter MFP subunit
MIRMACVTAALCALSGCAKHQNGVVEASSAAVVQSVPVVKATRANITGSITLTGEFTPFQEVDVMAKVAGYIREIHVDVGDRVRQGQVLAQLEVPEMQDELTRAAAAIEQANAETSRAQDDLKRTESAHDIAHLSLARIEKVARKEPGLVPQQEVDEIRSRDLESEAQVAAAKSNLSAAQERVRVLRADQARLQTMLRYETIPAPFDGVVTKRYANTGSMIQAGTASQTQAMPVVRVSENGLLRLILPVPESAVPQVAVGRAVSVRVPALGRTFAGRVARYTDKLQLSTRTMDTEVDVPNPSFSIVPGMYAEVDLQLKTHTGVIAVPVDAIEGTGANAKVFAVTESGQIRVIPVKPGIETAQQAEIEQGLNEGDLVVVGRRAGLKEGDRVKPVPASFENSSSGS